MQIWGPTHRGSDPVSPGEGTNARVPASSRGACCCSEHHTWSGQIKGQGRGSPLGGPHSAVQGRAGPCPSLSPAISHRVEGMKPAVRITAASLPVVTFSCDFRRPLSLCAACAGHAGTSQWQEDLERERHESRLRGFRWPGRRGGDGLLQAGWLGPCAGRVSVGAGRWTSRVARSQQQGLGGSR